MTERAYSPQETKKASIPPEAKKLEMKKEVSPPSKQEI